MITFRHKHDEEYPEFIRVFCEKLSSSKLQEIDKKKYHVPPDLTCGQFIYSIRRRLKLPSEKALFLFVNGTIPATSAMMNAIHEQHKDKEGVLHVTYGEENIFG